MTFEFDLDRDLEEHVVLRVPPELSERVKAVVKPLPGKEPEDVSIKKVNDSETDFTFQIGQDRYHAKLRTLPTVVESWKTKPGKQGDANDNVYFKSANVGQVLEVSNVKVVAGAAAPSRSNRLDDGLTPPMHQATERYSRMDRSEKHNLPKDNASTVTRMDNELAMVVVSILLFFFFGRCCCCCGGGVQPNLTMFLNLRTSC